jgi:hypothetical protein
MYSFPARWTLNGFSTPENQTLSETDREFIGSKLAYAKNGQAGGPTKVKVDGPAVQAEIGKPGEEDLFQFDAEEAGVFAIETTGNADVFMTLFGPDSQTTKITEDDDSGPGLNARIVESLNPATYYVQVRHYNRESGKGKYGLKVSPA